MTGRAGRWLGHHLALVVAFTSLPIFPQLPVLELGSVSPGVSGLSAQTVQATGRIVASDSGGVPRVRVILHRVGQELQGPIDSTSSGLGGRFGFRFRSDTAAFYILSARYAGVEYFSQPVRTDPQQPDTAIRILVYDTSSTTPVTLAARHIVVTRPGPDGARSVLDLMIIRNDGRLTRVSPDTAHPVWSAPLPAGTVGLELSESDFSRDAVSRRGDSVMVIAPLAPGDKQLTVQYVIPSSRSGIELSVASSGATINVMAEEPAVRVTGEGIAQADSQVLQGRSFRRWTGVAQSSSVLRVELPTRQSAGVVLAALVGVLALVLGAAGWRLLSRPRRARDLGDADLLDALAALDARYAGREAEISPTEWTSYTEERARLKARLEASLAAGGWSR
jgi:hypothetical protein